MHPLVIMGLVFFYVIVETGLKYPGEHTMKRTFGVVRYVNSQFGVQKGFRNLLLTMNWIFLLRPFFGVFLPTCAILAGGRYRFYSHQNTLGDNKSIIFIIYGAISLFSLIASFYLPKTSLSSISTQSDREIVYGKKEPQISGELFFSQKNAVRWVARNIVSIMMLFMIYKSNSLVGSAGMSSNVTEHYIFLYLIVGCMNIALSILYAIGGAFSSMVYGEYKEKDGVITKER